MDFSPILHVFEESGSDYFDKESLRDLRRDSEKGTCHENWSPEAQRLYKEYLSEGWASEEVAKWDKSWGKVCCHLGGPQPGGGRSLHPCKACRGSPKHGGQPGH